MCMRNSEEGCVLAAQQNELKGRVTVLEREVANIRAETQAGFKQGAETMREINASVSNLAHDFGERMNNLDKRIVAEKEKWGETLRWVVRIAVKVILAGTLLAMGINAIDKFFCGISHGEVSCEKTER